MTPGEARAIIEICNDATPDDDIAWMNGEETTEKEVAVGVVDFALHVIPRVRTKLQELRSNALLQQFGLFDDEAKGFITMESCHQPLMDMGVDVQLFDEIYEAETAAQDA